MRIGSGALMKKTLAFLAAIAVAASLTGCGRFPSLISGNDGPDMERTTEASEADEPTTEDEDLFADIRQECSKTLNNEQKPEVAKVLLSGICDGDIRSYARITDLYGVDVLHSEVVGLVGPPVELTFTKEGLKEPEIGFVYNKDELRGVPEENLIILHYNGKGGSYDTVNGAVIEKEYNRITVPIKEDGVYLLADAYQWYGAWGLDVSGYEYNVDKSQYDSDWERGGDTGSIMELVDKQWAMENAPNFHVSNAKQLASATYYVNAIADEYEPVTITLEDDIDLTDMDWKPLGSNLTGRHGFTGVVDGKYHIIKGLHISLDYEDAGFIGYSTDAVMRNITFTDAYVSGTACTGIAGGEIYGTNVWENVSVHGRVDGGNDDYGGIIGREASITFKDCVCDATVNGAVTEYPSYRQKLLAETPVEETFTLTLNDDYTITRDEHKGFQNLCWHVELDGVQVLERGTEDPRTGEPELVLDTQYQWIKGSSGRHTIYLVAFKGHTYVRVSNIIEYTI